MQRELKLGKKPHVEDSRDLMLAEFIDKTVLPSPPETFSFADVVLDGEWGMFLNNKLGSCAPAEVLHTQMVLGRLGEHHPEFNDACAELAYQEMGGYVPGEPDTDQGCDLRDVAKVWQKVGVPDVNGHRHRCGLYLWLEPGNVEELKLATYLFKAGCLGYRLTANAQEAYWEAEEQGTRPTWNYDPSSPEIGGHAVPEFGQVEESYYEGVSWELPVNIADEYVENQMDSGFVVVSSSVFGEDGEIEGFDHEKLVAAIKELGIEYR